MTSSTICLSSPDISTLVWTIAFSKVAKAILAQLPQVTESLLNLCPGKVFPFQ